MRNIICLMLLMGMLTISSTAIAGLNSPNPTLDEVATLYITREGFVAATEEKLLTLAIKMALNGSREEFNVFILGHPLIFYLKSNLWARVEQSSHPGKIKIYLIEYGLSVWTLKEAIE